MSDIYRVRMVYGHDLKPDNVVWSRGLEGWARLTVGGTKTDHYPYLVLDETPGVFLEGVTAEMIASYVLDDGSDESLVVHEAMLKAAES